MRPRRRAGEGDARAARGRREALPAGSWGRGDRGLSRPGSPRRGLAAPKPRPRPAPPSAAGFLCPSLCPLLPPRPAPPQPPAPVRCPPCRAERAGGGAQARRPRRRPGDPARGNERGARERTRRSPGQQRAPKLVSFEGRRNCVVTKVAASYPFLPTSRPALWSRVHLLPLTHTVFS